MIIYRNYSCIIENQVIIHDSIYFHIHFTLLSIPKLIDSLKKVYLYYIIL